MAIKNVLDVLLNPGVLYHTPTDLSDDPGGFGTALGMIQEVQVKRTVTNVPLQAVEFATVTEYTYAGESWLLACTLRGWDNDAIGTVFEASSLGSVSGKRLVTHDPDTRPAVLASSRAVPLLFVPFDRTHGLACYFRNAIPITVEEVIMPFDPDEESIVAVVFHAIPDSDSDPAVQLGILADMSI